jgi:hypothetical protein
MRSVGHVAHKGRTDDYIILTGKVDRRLNDIMAQLEFCAHVRYPSRFTQTVQISSFQKRLFSCCYVALYFPIVKVSISRCLQFYTFTASSV